MSDSLAFNKYAGALLATGFVIALLVNASGMVFGDDKVAKPGFKVEVAEGTGGGAAVADVPPDWGTVLPKADASSLPALPSDLFAPGISPPKTQPAKVAGPPASVPEIPTDPFAPAQTIPSPSNASEPKAELPADPFAEPSAASKKEGAAKP